ncbi:MAG: radical SAM protein [Syntrophorhabdaceae bacterium]|nr:radical SAM protein [Syntrophorhabdaceae bacterium]
MSGPTAATPHGGALLEQVFSIPLEEGKFLVYAPLKGIAFIANPALVNAITDQCRAQNPEKPNGSDLEFLHQLGFFSPEPILADEYAEQGVVYDTVVLFLTNQCNLRCSYCYASSGDFMPKMMSWEVAKAAVDRVMGDVVARGANEMTLGFHGGGEPTMNWEILTRITDYACEKAAENGLALHVSGAFNGYWSSGVREYILSRFTDVSLSFDGLPDVQNSQRPAAGNKASFDRVAETLAALDQSDVSYGIRMTVTRDHIARLAESVAYICDHFRPIKIQAEPVFLEGRAKEEHAVDDSGMFVEQFITAHRVATRHGIDFFYSGARPDVTVLRFCLAACRALVVTADGDVVTCFESYGKEHPLSARYIVGGYRGGGEFLVDRDKLDAHFSRTADSIPYCQGCFCRWHCAGDCAIKASVAGRANEFAPTGRCVITQELTKYLILDKIRGSGGLVWQRNADFNEKPQQEVAHE